MKQKTLNLIVRTIIYAGIIAAIAGGYYAYLVNQLVK
jgi:hypothetical protein